MATREWNPDFCTIRFGGRTMTGWDSCETGPIQDQVARTGSSTDNVPYWVHQPDDRSRGELVLSVGSPDWQFCRDMVRKPINVVIADDSLKDGYTGLDAKIVAAQVFQRERDGDPKLRVRWEAARTYWEASTTQHATTGV